MIDGSKRRANVPSSPTWVSVGSLHVSEENSFNQNMSQGFMLFMLLAILTIPHVYFVPTAPPGPPVANLCSLRYSATLQGSTP